MSLIVQREDIARLEPEWRDLLGRCPRRSVFLSPAWLKCWWDEFEGGRELMLLAVRDGSELVGVAPLMREGASLTFAGDTEVFDYMDFVCRSGREHAVVEAVLRSLSEEPWETVALWALPEDSPTLAALQEVCPVLSLTVEQELEDVCPQMALPAGWDAYLAGLRKKDRHELRRKLRRLHEAGDVQLEVVDTPGGIDASMDEFIHLHTVSRHVKAGFMTERMQRFFRAAVASLAADGLAEMLFLRLSGVRVAAVLCFRGDAGPLVYNSGYDPTYRELAVGLMSKALAVRRAIEAGYTRFDFLRGAEPYKQDLGAEDFYVYRCVIHRA